jgi:hypothetical protein
VLVGISGVAVVVSFLRDGVQSDIAGKALSCGELALPLLGKSRIPYMGRLVRTLTGNNCPYGPTTFENATIKFSRSCFLSVAAAMSGLLGTWKFFKHKKKKNASAVVATPVEPNSESFRPESWPRRAWNATLGLFGVRSEFITTPADGGS